MRYKILDVGEIILEGDEVHSGKAEVLEKGATWHKQCCSTGFRVAIPGLFRRTIAHRKPSKPAHNKRIKQGLKPHAKRTS